jgi:hypothetical protein
MKTSEIAGKVFSAGGCAVRLVKSSRGVTWMEVTSPRADYAAEAFGMTLGPGSASDLIECLQAALKEAL